MFAAYYCTRISQKSTQFAYTGIRTIKVSLQWYKTTYSRFILHFVSDTFSNLCLHRNCSNSQATNSSCSDCYNSKTIQNKQSINYQHQPSRPPPFHPPLHRLLPPNNPQRRLALRRHLHRSPHHPILLRPKILHRPRNLPRNPFLRLRSIHNPQIPRPGVRPNPPVVPFRSIRQATQRGDPRPRDYSAYWGGLG